jgi:hypothetical protein
MKRRVIQNEPDQSATNEGHVVAAAERQPTVKARVAMEGDNP